MGSCGTGFWEVHVDTDVLCAVTSSWLSAVSLTSGKNCWLCSVCASTRGCSHISFWDSWLCAHPGSYPPLPCRLTWIDSIGALRGRGASVPHGFSPRGNSARLPTSLHVPTSQGLALDFAALPVSFHRSAASSGASRAVLANCFVPYYLCSFALCSSIAEISTFHNSLYMYVVKDTLLFIRTIDLGSSYPT